MSNRTRPRGLIRPLHPSHPQSWDNPANEDRWIDLARTIGRQIARDEVGLMRIEDEFESPLTGRKAPP